MNDPRPPNAVGTDRPCSSPDDELVHIGAHLECLIARMEESVRLGVPLDQVRTNRPEATRA